MYKLLSRMQPCDIILNLLIAVIIPKAWSYRCDRVPSDLLEHTKSNPGKYFLEIDGKPDAYVPTTKYQITVKVNSYVYPNSKFKKFIVSLESKTTPDDEEGITYQTGKFEVGSDGLSKFSDTCKDTVVEANTLPKKQVTLFWKAPSSDSGCVSIRATVIESRERWYADAELASDGYLTKTLCEDLNEDEDVLPEVLEYCCACHEAKYEVAFQGNWIRNNHPKGFPEDQWTTKFSNIIGASHKNNQHFWEDGAEPSPGLKELAFNASLKTLESELMGNIANLHTIIAARGLSYPNITSSSYATFRVDNQNHLVSLVTKMMPSPDWVVGVSSMELCLSNCSWKQSRSINLYPKDVGIDDAVYYTDSEPSTNEQPKITEITSSEPADPKSPFYDETGEKMKPIARLHFKLIKVYQKECDPDRQPPEDTNDEEQEQIKSYDREEEQEEKEPEYRQYMRRNRLSSAACETIGWSKWSSCSVQCGKGHMTRNVKFKYNPHPGACLDIAREETQECEAPCESGEENMQICSDIIWGPWTPCTVTCGKGLKQRYRIPSMVQEEDEIDKQCANKEFVECYEEDC